MMIGLGLAEDPAPRTREGLRKTTIHGHPILARCLGKRDGEELILAFLLDNDYTPFVSWAMDSATGACYWGRYYHDLAEAMEGFGDRAAGK